MWNFNVKDDKEIREILEVMDMVCKDRSDVFRKVHNVGSDEKPKSHKELSKELNYDIFDISKIINRSDLAFEKVRDYRKNFLNIFSSKDWNYEKFKEATRYIDFIFFLLDIKSGSEFKCNKKHSFSDVVLFIDEEFKNNLDLKDIEILKYFYGLHHQYCYSVEEISSTLKMSEYHIRRSIRKSARTLREEREEFLNFFGV